jgi:hypothetical protein
MCIKATPNKQLFINETTSHSKQNMSNKAETVADIASHKIDAKTHMVQKEVNKATMNDPNAPVLDRASAAVNAAGHAVAENYHEGAKNANETKLKNQVRGEALASAAEHKAEQKSSDVKYEVNKSTMNDPNAPILDRAGAAVSAAGNAVSSNYHSTAADAKYQEAKRV